MPLVDFPRRPAKPLRFRRALLQPTQPAAPMDEKIIYDFTFEDGLTFHFEVPLQGWSEQTTPPDPALPDWTLLTQDRCPNCPLDPAQHRYCPTAVDLHAAAKKFSAIASYRSAQVTVLVGRRTYQSTCDMNTGLRSLFGLYMALGECPVTARLRPMALRHLPFATLEETLGRVVQHYLLKQYYVFKDGGTPDWELRGLLGLYDELEEVNRAFLARLKHASERDSNLNAICGFATFGRLYAMALDDLLSADKAVFLKGF